MTFQSRKRWAQISFALLIVFLVAAALIQTMPTQGWLAGGTLLSLLFLRGLWRCPHCGLALPAFPFKEMAQCPHCEETLG